MSISALQKHILWCRKNGISWSSLTFGGIHMEGSDMLASDGLPKPKDERAPAPSIQQRYGAALLEEAGKSEGMTSVVEEDV